jgi:hypothetical protein
LTDQTILFTVSVVEPTAAQTTDRNLLQLRVDRADGRESSVRWIDRSKLDYARRDGRELTSALASLLANQFGLDWDRNDWPTIQTGPRD